MNKILVCTVRKSIITVYGEYTIEFVNHSKGYSPSKKAIHKGKRCPPVNFYLGKDGMYSTRMSDIRKEKLSRLNLNQIKESAINYITTKADINKLK